MPLQFYLNATCLSHNGEICQQIFGTTMGSQVSVTVESSGRYYLGKGNF